MTSLNDCEGLGQKLKRILMVSSGIRPDVRLCIGLWQTPKRMGGCRGRWLAVARIGSDESTGAHTVVDVDSSKRRTSVVLNTGRMRLRPISSDDVDALHALWTDPDVRRYLWDDRIIPRETVEDFVAQSLATFESEGFGFFALELQEQREGGLIGSCGHRRDEDAEGQIELLYGIHPTHWGE